jgi:hypothetical protein
MLGKVLGGTRIMTVTPYLGRDHTTGKSAKESWEAGNDWVVNDVFSRYNGKPINKAQADEAGIDVVLRFNKLTKVRAV